MTLDDLDRLDKLTPHELVEYFEHAERIAVHLEDLGFSVHAEAWAKRANAAKQRLR